jgi:hypothetical protein
MYNYDKKEIDKNEPYKIADEIAKMFNSTEIREIESEIFIMASNV